MLTEQEKYRYSRQTNLSVVGEKGQELIKKACVLVIGAGGLGCPVLNCLAGAGIGKLGIVDFDTVDISNLHRQVLFTSQDVGKNKSEQAAKRLKELNNTIEFVAYPYRLDHTNIGSVFKDYDLIIDCTDNLVIRYLINDACVLLDKPFVYGSIHRFEGQVSIFNYKGGPTYRCLFPEPPTHVQNCNDIGVLPGVTGTVGTIMANEALKLIMGIGEILSGKVLHVDTLNNQFHTLSLTRKKESGQVDLNNLDQYSGFDLCEYKNSNVKQISIDDFSNLLKTDTAFLDVREHWEFPKITHPMILRIPLDQLEDRITEIPRDRSVVVLCQSGGRSRIAIQLLQKHFKFNNLINLENGLKNFVQQT